MLSVMPRFPSAAPHESDIAQVRGKFQGHARSYPCRNAARSGPASSDPGVQWESGSSTGVLANRRFEFFRSGEDDRQLRLVGQAAHVIPQQHPPFAFDMLDVVNFIQHNEPCTGGREALAAGSIQERFKPDDLGKEWARPICCVVWSDVIRSRPMLLRTGAGGRVIRAGRRIRACATYADADRLRRTFLS